MDTVPADNMDIEPFSGEIREGRIWGRGACDNKGTLAAIVHALGVLARDADGARATVTFVGSVDEESGFSGMYKLAQSGVRADAALVGEPTGLALVTATRGAARWQIATRGVAAHTCHPERGVNAIYKMAGVITALRERVRPRFAERAHPLLGSPELTVSLIRGGTRCNIVPDECTIDVDRRLLPGEREEDVVEEVESVLDELRSADAELDVEMHKPYTFVPGTEIEEGSPIVRAAWRAAEDAGVEARIGGVPYTTHASVLSQRDIPCLVFGPGHVEQAHTAAEYVEVEQVEKAAEVLVGLCKSFGG
jgi:acetylornithine deacetylase